MKHTLAKAVLYSLLAPVLIGVVLGIYYALGAQQNGAQLFFAVLLSAIANAHILGLAMAVFVVPGYLLMYKYNKVHYSGVLTLGLLGGALFSYAFGAQAGFLLIVNALMAALGSGLFLFALRQGSAREA
ncbi:hypothetical protein [Pseudoalteromonas ruthenica]|uniref:hypothetical protein n=1 Tax=Pseudoalteromonas ruthenica TaxID=151081 RepID=UPI001108B700|nr:hypothetical protein [Pseudoalteromonas ruthenica]TLX51561.1 hypothetical protein CWC31_05310 [Pseudoalteromonas ruthenica]TMO44554.1 hypothetical protein CWC24_13505 [Pseudoalteromonas ruthenica]TMO51176.1 hypothetical protein CWC23_08535 [Pseudoalteromonas ruthenica]